MLLCSSCSCRSCFCKLLERLHLLDALWKASNPGPTPGPQADQQLGPAEIVPDASQVSSTRETHPCLTWDIRAMHLCYAHAPCADSALLFVAHLLRFLQEPVQCPALPFINQLESALRGTSGLDTVLAALIAHAQQNAAVGSKLAHGALAPASSKQEVLEVSCLSAVQEHHSSARALPLLIRLYFNTGSRAEVSEGPQWSSRQHAQQQPIHSTLHSRCLCVHNNHTSPMHAPATVRVRTPPAGHCRWTA